MGLGDLWSPSTQSLPTRPTVVPLESVGQVTTSRRGIDTKPTIMRRSPFSFGSSDGSWSNSNTTTVNLFRTKLNVYLPPMKFNSQSLPVFPLRTLPEGCFTDEVQLSWNSLVQVLVQSKDGPRNGRVSEMKVVVLVAKMPTSERSRFGPTEVHHTYLLLLLKRSSYIVLRWVSSDITNSYLLPRFWSSW